MNLAQVAFQRLFPDKESKHSFRLRYSGRFSGFNGNVSKRHDEVTVSLSRNWMRVAPDIQVGIIQELFVKLYKVRKHTMEMDLYANFLRSVHTEIPKTESHPLLASSFDRINTQYFQNSMEKPNLAVSNGTRTLGYYDYGRDQISVTQHLFHDEELLDYVMYHEMLHKHFKFSSKNGRTHHHTKQFRDAEKRFTNSADCEKRLSRISRKFKWRLW